ncbi:hypothetical protein LTR86_008248 [Recurvomyces mirabilis]|nr:hypothetical protein LTR86_008248 [Recurvomyces mirabilis]
MATTADQTTRNQSMLRQRLLRDIAELKNNPYPGIRLDVKDHSLHTACLVLSPEGEKALHLTINFGDDYPIKPPQITIQSEVDHPNVYDDYICASILNTQEGYTPAYTLKGICIQMLSFFASDMIEQDYGGTISRKGHDVSYQCGIDQRFDGYRCAKCDFGNEAPARTRPLPGAELADVPMSDAPSHEAVISSRQAKATTPDPSKPLKAQKLFLIDLPNELLVLITEHMDEQSLLIAARAWNGFSRLLASHNLLRVREMQCYTLKAGFKTHKLGVGVYIERRSIQSEFDIISEDAFAKLGVRRSVQGLYFDNWLPLPLSENHWKRMGNAAYDTLAAIGTRAQLANSLKPVDVLYAFMNDITVKLSQSTSETAEQPKQNTSYLYNYGIQAKSTLTHASEKAVESYFQVYHLLIVMATDRPKIAEEANAHIKRFLDRERDTSACPNLGHLLVALLIADTSTSNPVELTKAIIKEAVTRNVVWMLDARGANMPELSYMEPSDTSPYRLQKSFEASKTSYTLLMFAHLMLKTVTASSPSSSPSPFPSPANTDPQILTQIRTDLFARHGAPPPGAAAKLAAEIRNIQRVKTFPAFLMAMDVPIPTQAAFTQFLRKTVSESVEKGYSRWGLTQEEALFLRLQREPGVMVAEGLRASGGVRPGFTFFPGEGRGGGGRGGRGGRAGRGGGSRGGRGRVG